MFIGWLKFSDVNEVVKLAEEQGLLVDGFHIKLMIMHTPYLCYGAYEEGKMIGAAMAIHYEKSTMIKYLMVKSSHQSQGVGKRLMHTLVEAIEGENRDIYLHAHEKKMAFFEKFGFETVEEVGRFLNVGKVPPFSFTNAHAKELDGSDFDIVVSKIDHQTYGEDRLAFLFDEMDRSSSLKFTLPHSFQHSSVINARNVHLGPWQVGKGYGEEAEKMMKGVLYFRGLKKVVADVPMSNTEAIELYRSYHFQKKERFVHMRKGKAMKVDFSMIYAFSL